MKQIWNKFKLVQFISAIFIIPTSVKSQSKDNIEFSFFTSYNKQADYCTQYGNVATTNHLILYGTDLGFKLDYKRLYYGKTYFKIGLGYIGFGINKIENQTRYGNSLVISNARPINYPNTVFILYSTSKYYYNNLLFHIGLERQFAVSPTLSLLAGLDYIHANSLSQKYFIPEPQTYYQTSNQGNFGDFFNFNLGLSKKLGNFSFSPALVLPVYKSWRKDVVFRENPINSVSNWGSGIGIILSVSYH